MGRKSGVVKLSNQVYLIMYRSSVEVLKNQVTSEKKIMIEINIFHDVKSSVIYHVNHV